MRPIRFRPPIHLAAAAAVVVAGVASYQGVDHLVLAKSGHSWVGAHEPGHDTAGPSTSTTIHYEPPGPSTTTTVHTEPPPPPSTSTTIHYEPPGPSTSTTIPHEPTAPSTTTTVHTEPPPPTTPTTKPYGPPPTTTVAQLSFGCLSAIPSDGIPTARCAWSQSKSPNFHHYRLTRELVGTPRQTIFTTEDIGTTMYYDRGLQPGAQYSYIIEAYDAAGNLVGRGGPVHVTCCDGVMATQ